MAFLRDLVDTLGIGLSAALRGWTAFERMEALGLERKDFFRRSLELPLGIPEAYPYNRAFSMVEPARPLKALRRWYAESGKPGGRPLKIDGKTVRGSAPM